MKHMGELYVGVDCDNCGIHGDGKPVSENLNRCMKCGQFAPEPEAFCVKHGFNYEGLYSEDNHCPKCREERRIRDMRQHEMTRDPQIEPW